MITYKYQDIFSLLRTKHRCADCKDINHCYWHRPKKNPGMEACGDMKHNYQNPEVVPTNANWLLFQMGRDIELSKNVIIQRNNMLFNELKSPGALRSNHLPDIAESKVYVETLKTFLTLIIKFEKELKSDREKIVSDIRKQKVEIVDEIEARKKIQLESKLRLSENRLLSMDSEIGRFVGSIINTTIKVNGNEIFIFTESEDLMDEVKKIVGTYNYTLTREKSPEEARKWLGRITSAS